MARHMAAKLAAALILAITLSGVNLGAWAADRPPLKVGILVPYSKVYALLGESITRGVELYFDQAGGQAGGRKIEVIKEDEENPPTALRKARKLVENDKVDVIIGLVNTAAMYAVRDFMNESKAMLIVANAGGNQLCRSKKSPYVFRSSDSNWQLDHPMGKWYYQNVGKEVLLVAPDYAAGREHLNCFKEAFVKEGGKVLGEVLAPLGTSDYGPYMTEISQSKAPGVYCFFAGTDAVRFVKQWAEYGLKGKMALTGSGFMFGDDVLPAQGESALGGISSLNYAYTMDSPENKSFKEAYLAKFKEDPNLYSVFGYDAAHALVEAVNQINGKTEDKAGFIKALEAAKFASPRGPFSFDPVTHNVISNVYVLKVESVDGKPRNVVIHNFGLIKDTGE